MLLVLKERMGTTSINFETLLKESTVVPVKKRKFLIVGTHAQQTTGYSKVMYSIIGELAKLGTLELFHFGFQRFLQLAPEYRRYPLGVDIYDPAEVERNNKAPQENGFGFSQLPDYVRKIKPDSILIYNDAGIICKFLEKLTENLTEEERKQYNMIIYLDQVYIIQRPELLGRIERDADVYFAFTTYWKKILEKQGVQKPIHILRHGFNPSEFITKNRAEMRRKHGLSEDLIVFLNLNRNTVRKRHDIVVMAFAELVSRHLTKPLALLAVCDGGEMGGYLLREIYLRELEHLGVSLQLHGHKLIIAPAAMSYTDEIINELYSLSDVGITAAVGEGFGLCQFEAMGVGIPQVVPFIGGFRDFCENGKNSLTVTPRHRSYIPLEQSYMGGLMEIVDPHDLMLAAEEYVMDPEMRLTHGVNARRTVLQYSWAKEVAGLEKVIQMLPSPKLDT